MRLVAVLGVGLALAVSARAATSPFPGAPTPAVISYNLTPVVNAVLAKNHWTRWRFAKAVCVYTGHRGQYLCTSAHVAAGVPVDGYVDVWEVDVKGGSWSYRASSVCPLPGRCVNTDTTPLNQPLQ